MTKLTLGLFVVSAVLTFAGTDSFAQPTTDTAVPPAVAHDQEELKAAKEEYAQDMEEKGTYAAAGNKKGEGRADKDARQDLRNERKDERELDASRKASGLPAEAN